MKRKRIYYPWLDFLRFAGCLLIFFYHYDGICNFSLPVNNSAFWDFVIRNGNEAIVLFFMISGFCMSAGYREKIMDGKESFGKYACSHYLKFLSMILLTLPLTVVKSICMYKAGLDTMPNLYGFLLDILNIRTGYNIHACFGYNGPLWFINVLFILYIAYFGVCRFCKGRTVYRTTCIAITLFSISQMANGTFVWFVLNSSTYIGLASFFLGCLIYELTEAVIGNRVLQRRIRNLCLGIIVGILLTIYFNVNFPGIGKLSEESNLFMNYQLVLLLTLWPSLLYLATNSTKRSPIVSVEKIFGKLATSVYIWHWPVLYLQYALILKGKIQWSMGSLWGFLTSFGITFVISILSTISLEQKVFIGVKKLLMIKDGEWR